jgi:hypothetical protein
MWYNSIMASPFIGMDPYLEGFWNDVHGPLLTYIADELNSCLPPQFRATIRRREIHLDAKCPAGMSRYRDVTVLDLEPLTQYSVEIVDTKFGEKVITAIEVLSPENKRPGDGMLQFHKKQDEYRRARVSRVEIDLLREGRRLFDFPLRLLTPEQIKPYYVTVNRGHRPGESELYAIDMREPLPVIGVPLRANDADVPLDLQPLMEHVYRTGRFPIDYDDPCDPPLQGDDAAWAQDLLGKRRTTEATRQ